MSFARVIRCRAVLIPAKTPNLTMEDFSAAQVNFTPLSLRDIKLQKSEVQWSDIGGWFTVGVECDPTQPVLLQFLRTARDEADFERNTRMADQIQRDFYEMPAEITIRVRILCVMPLNLTDSHFPKASVVRVSGMRKNPACVSGCEGMWPQFHQCERPRTFEQVYRRK